MDQTAAGQNEWARRGITAGLRHVLLLAATLATSLIVMAATAQAANPASPASLASPSAAPPTLRLNSAFAAPIWQLGLDASETYLVSSSAYKALSVWPLPDLSSRRTLRLPLRREQRKRAHGAAISPDAVFIAASVPPRAGKDGLPVTGTARISILERRSGQQVRVLDGIATRPQALRFSPGGKYLAAVLSDGCGLLVWRVADWSLFYRDDAGYGGAGQSAAHCTNSGAALDMDALPDTTGLEFAGEGAALWLVTSGDTGVRSYGLGSGQPQRLLWRKPAELGLERPGDIAFSPDSSQLVVAERRDKRSGGPVKLQLLRLSAADLHPIGQPLAVLPQHLRHPGFLDPKQNRDANQTSFSQLAWVKSDMDGEDWIFAGGVFWCAYAAPDLLLDAAQSITDICLARFSVQDPEAGPSFIPAGSDRIMDIVPLPGHGGIIYAGQRRIAAIDFAGQPLELPGGDLLEAQNRAADFRDGAMAFSISADARQVYFEDYRGRHGAPQRVSFDVSQQKITEGQPAAPGLIAPHHDPNLLSGWRNSHSPPLVLGQPLSESTGRAEEVFRSAAILPQQKLILLGSSDFLHLMSTAGGAPQVICRLPITHEAYRVNITPDGTLAVIGHSDGTLRWYRIVRGQGGCRFNQMLAVHLMQDRLGKWIWTAWLPSGKFANDPRARTRIGWQLEVKPGQVSYVPYHKLLRLYDGKAIAAALDQSLPAPRVKGFKPALYQADKALGQARNGLQILQPADMKGVSDAHVRFLLDTRGLKQWPASLQVYSGSGVRLEKRLAGQVVAAEAPIQLVQPGTIAFDIVLPQVLRRANRAIHICFDLNGQRSQCHALIWKGKLAKPKPRRLWAVIIGVSKHKFSSYDLPFTQNDAIDLAQMFVDDYQRRVVRGASKVAPDFSEINIDLIVSPSTKSAEDQIRKLSRHPYVTSSPATRQGILKALNRLVERDRAEQLSNDLFLFHFSGHGFIHPYNRDAGRSAFVTYGTDPDLSRSAIDSHVLTSADLIKVLDRISAEKLVIIDACRVPVKKSGGQAFDPGLVSAEFQDQVLSAHYFFSGQAGQYSLDQAGYAFDRTRPVAERGNGLFSYALLKALSDKDADLPGKAAGRNKIEIIEVKRYLDRLFDLGDSNSLASTIRRTERRQDIQQPVYIPSRRLGGKSGPAGSPIIRSLEPE